MRGRFHVLGAIPELLLQSLARSHAREHDVDVLSGLEPGEPHQIAGHVGDPDGLAHVEHEDLSVPRQRRSAEDELHRLRNGHEIPGHVRVGDGDRSAPLDLFLEERHDATTATEDVSKPHSAKNGLAAGRIGRHGLQVALGDALGGPHDTRRIDGLVGGNQHEGRGPMGNSDLDQIPRAHDIVEHGFVDVPLHQRHVLVRCGVEDHPRPVAPEHLIKLVPVFDIDQKCPALRTGKPLAELRIDLEQGVFALVEQHEELGLLGGDLPADLRSDRPSRAGDQDAPPVEVAPHGDGIEVQRLSSQQVLQRTRLARAVPFRS